MRKQANARFLHRRIVAVLMVGLFAAGSSLLRTKADAPDVFRGRGESASATLFNVDINGTVYPRVQLNVFRDVASNSTTLIINAFEVPTTFGNRTVNRLAGPIPSASFVLASDLTSGSLNTIVNTVGNLFNNADVGALVNYGINLSWSADTIGNLVDTSVFNGSTVGNPGAAYRETFHQNGPHAEGGVTGMMGPTTISNGFGSMDANRSFDIYQPR